LNIAIDDKQMKDKYIKLQERNELLEKQVNELKIEELNNEITKNKVEYFRKSLEESRDKISNNVESIKNLEVKSSDQKEVLSSHLDKLSNENEKMNNIINEIIDFFKVSNKFIGDNIIEFVTNFIENWNKMLSTLSFEQLVAVAHLSASLCILINLFNIISVLFGNQLINYFKLEERFPKLLPLLNLRNKLIKINLSFSFIIIITILIALIYVNTKILINF
jgi:hypothetical protein